MKVYEYPAGTVDGEPIVTDELLNKQQQEINASIKRTNNNMKRVSLNILSLDHLAFGFVVLMVIFLITFYGIIFSATKYNKEKDMTDAITQRIVNQYQQGESND